MYAHIIANETETRRFTITARDPAGWEVCEEHDDRVIRRVLYDDWHRVERARMAFARTASVLKDVGWVEKSVDAYSTKR